MEDFKQTKREKHPEPRLPCQFITTHVLSVILAWSCGNCPGLKQNLGMSHQCIILYVSLKKMRSHTQVNYKHT